MTPPANPDGHTATAARPDEPRAVPGNIERSQAASSAPRTLLLIRESPFQYYCANQLFQAGAIDCVFVEDGDSIQPDGHRWMTRLLGYGPAGWASRVARDLRELGGSPKTLLDYYLTRVATRPLMNRRAFHEARILGRAGTRLEPGLRCVRGGSVNEEACLRVIQEGGYSLVFTFGTALLREPLASFPPTTFVNLHWGWAPQYRGEGIISALAKEGPSGLGVTVHVVDQGIDRGPILYRERPLLEPEDNVYAIGLKLTVLGTGLLLRVYRDARQNSLHAEPQQISEGRLYDSRFTKRHYWARRAALEALTEFRAAAQGPGRGGGGQTPRRRRGTLHVLLYHEVAPEGSGFLKEHGMVVSPELFEFQIRVLRRHFQIIGPDELLAGAWQNDACVLLTFDDGFPGVFRYAAPILSRYRLPAVAFVNVGDLEHGYPWSALNAFVAKFDPLYRDRLKQASGGATRLPELLASPRMLEEHCARAPVDMDRFHQYLGPFATPALLEACAATHATLYFGNHLFRHYNAARLSGKEFAEAYRRNAEALERFSTARPLFAFPFGMPNLGYTRRTVEAVQRLGARAVFSAFPRVNGWGGKDAVLHRIAMGPQHCTTVRIVDRARVRGVRPALQRSLGLLGVSRYSEQLTR